MKNYVGRKIKGFRFEDIDGVYWMESKEEYIGEVGQISFQYDNHVLIEFKIETWAYPISLIEPHLIEEESPDIPQLGEGVLMEVSDDGEDWAPRKVVGQLQNGDFVTASVTWKKARPIPQLPKYTHAELVEKLGEDFIYQK